MCISFHYRFEIIYIIISTITYGLKETSKTILQNRHKEYKKNISFLTGLIKYFAIISMIIFYFIKKKFHGEKTENPKKIKATLLIICVCIYFSIDVFINQINKNFKNILDGTKMFTIFSFSFIYTDLLFFLKENLNHYIFTFIIFLINLINVVIYSLFTNKNKLLVILYLIILLIKSQATAFAHLLFEYINRNYLLDMYFLIIFEGIPKFIFIIIIIFLKNIKMNFGIFNKLDYILLFIHYLTIFLYTYTKCKIFEKLRAIHFILVLCIFEILFPIFHLNFKFNIMDLIIGFISLFGCLIYCEIIILHFCGLDKKTMNNFLSLAQIEISKCFIEDDNKKDINNDYLIIT